MFLSLSALSSSVRWCRRWRRMLLLLNKFQMTFVVQLKEEFRTKCTRGHGSVSDKYMGGRRQEEKQETMITQRYHQLCRKSVQTPVLYGSGTTCYWHSTQFPFVKFKAEVVNVDPSIVIFHDVIHDEEMAAIKNLSHAKLSPSTLTGTKVAQQRNRVRVSQTAWLFDSASAVVSALSQRVQLVTGHSTKILSEATHAEPYQVVNYGIGGMNGLHEDSVRILRQEGQENFPILQDSGDRMCTWMFYLSEVSLGGATVFPLLDAGIRPEKGAAVFWYNVKRSGEGDSRMVHAGCPVLHGDKWVANKWIREVGSVFTRTCALVPDL